MATKQPLRSTPHRRGPFERVPHRAFLRAVVGPCRDETSAKPTHESAIVSQHGENPPGYDVARVRQADCGAAPAWRRGRASRCPFTHDLRLGTAWSMNHKG
jgi:hypothetical protein